MKRKYESPLMVVEMFSPNRAIAECIQQDVTFDCMVGNQTDTVSVIIEESCTNVAGTTTLKKASNPYATGRHTTHTGGQWTSNSGRGYTYSNSGAYGLLYICAEETRIQNTMSQYCRPTTTTTYTNTKWTPQDDTLVHTGSHSGQTYHCQIAPLSSEATVAS